MKDFASLEKLIELLERSAESYKDHLYELNKHDPMRVNFVGYNNLNIVKAELRKRKQWFDEFYGDFTELCQGNSEEDKLKKAQAILQLVLDCDLSSFVMNSVEDALQIIDEVVDKP